jgi:protocatechuate 3,4-dioxygenase beta subunit
MRNLTEATVTDAVLATLAGAPDPRLREVAASLVRHLHAFVREVEPTEAEWLAGIGFLTTVGQMCDARRQEFILLSDTLGVSILVDAINHRKPGGATESSVLGPFYREGAPELPSGGNLAAATPGEPVLVSGRVTAPDGTPIAGALLDVWQTSPDGLYDVQDPSLPGMNLRGRFRTDAAGRYNFRTVKPTSYPIPDDGPVGQMLRALGRHSYRPAHIHFIVSAVGYEPVTTMLFVEGDRYLDSDAVFGVKGSLVVNFVRHDSTAEAAARGVPAPFHSVAYDFVLTPARPAS